MDGMSRGAEFLNYVTGQLKIRIRELDDTISAVQKDIAGMNDFLYRNREFCQGKRRHTADL